MKVCTVCKLEQPLANFQKQKRGKGGLSPRCRCCTSAYYKAYRAKRGDELNAASRKYYARGHTRLRRYGLGPEYSLATTCAICGSSGDGRWNTLNIDHDHKTGRIRGMLCMRCNKALGYFRDDHTLLERAVFYLKQG